jgi:hypothetical protein
MPWGFTLEQIRAATKTQIINWITNKLENMTKREIIELLLDIYSMERNPTVVYGPDGQITSLEAIEEDAEGVKIGSRLITWTYYKTGSEVNEIIVTWMDVEGSITRQYKIKHYRTGRQPVLTDIVVPELTKL